MPSPWGSGRVGLGSYRARPPDNFSPVSPLRWKPCPWPAHGPCALWPLPPLPDTPARCRAHCLGPSEAPSLLASRAWAAAGSPDWAPQRSPWARLRGKVLPVGQPGRLARKSRQPPQHSPAAGLARCPAPTSGHHHLSLQRLQPPPSQHPLCPFWSGLPRSTPSMWPPGSCPMDPASPSRVQTLTSRAVGAAESFHEVPPRLPPGRGWAWGRDLPRSRCPEHRIPLSGSEPQTAAFCPTPALPTRPTLLSSSS